MFLIWCLPLLLVGAAVDAELTCSGSTGTAEDTCAALEGEDESSCLQLHTKSALTAHQASSVSTVGGQPASTSVVDLSPPKHVYVLSAAWCTLLVLAFIQQRRYLGVVDERTQATESLQKLSQVDAVVALALETDENYRQRVQVNKSLALRAAFFIMFAASPEILRDVNQWFKVMRYDTSYTAVLIMWTMDRTVGRTAANVFDALLGTFLAFLFIYIASGFLPGGYHQGDPCYVWWVGMAYFLATTLGTMFLNFSNGVRIWCLSYHMANMMYFLEPKAPNSPPTFSESFRISTQGQMFGYMVITVVSCGLSMVAVSLPIPRSSHRIAMEKMDETKRQFSTMIRSLLCIYTQEEGAESKDACRRTIIYHDHIVDNLKEMDTDVAYSWWEHLDGGSYAAIRVMLGRHVTMSRSLLAGLEALMDSINYDVQSETEQETKLMKQIKVPLLALQESMLMLYEMVTDDAKDGVIDEHEAVGLANQVAVVERDILALSEAFRRACASLSAKGFCARHEDFKDQYRVLFCVCTMARLVVDFAQDLRKREAIPKKSIWQAFMSNSIFSGMSEQSHKDFATRNSISLLLCFFCGYVGNGALIPRYTAAIATNASLLLSTFVGSALQKNMGRVQGLVIGSVVGRFLHASVSLMGCGAMQFGLGTIATMGVFSCCSFYIYMSSPTFGYTASLFGGFGSIAILADCSTSEQLEDAYLSITCAMVCIITMAGVDLLMAPRAGKEATQAFLTFLRNKRAVLQSLLETGLLPRSGESFKSMRGLLDSTAQSAEEAAKAPSLLTRPFRWPLYTSAVDAARVDLIGVETLTWAMTCQHNTLREDEAQIKEEAKASAGRVLLKACRSFEAVSCTLLQVLDSVIVITETAMEAASSVEALHGSMDAHMRLPEYQALVGELVKEVGARIDDNAQKQSGVPLDQDAETSLHIVLQEFSNVAELAGQMQRHTKTYA